MSMTDEELIAATKKVLSDIYNSEAAEGGAWFAERAARANLREIHSELLAECSKRGIPPEATHVPFF